MIKFMEKEFIHMQMALCLPVSMQMERNREKENLCIPMMNISLVNTTMINDMEMEALLMLVV